MTYIIIKDVKVTIPGDERSRTNPGHGYPESTDTYQQVTFYDDVEEWKSMVRRLTLQRYTKFKAGTFMPANPTIEVKVDVPA
jgi:hypothetical protein